MLLHLVEGILEPSRLGWNFPLFSPFEFFHYTRFSGHYAGRVLGPYGIKLLDATLSAQECQQRLQVTMCYHSVISWRT